jgi:hypothetical protein
MISRWTAVGDLKPKALHVSTSGSDSPKSSKVAHGEREVENPSLLLSTCCCLSIGEDFSTLSSDKVEVEMSSRFRFAAALSRLLCVFLPNKVDMVVSFVVRIAAEQGEDFQEFNDSIVFCLSNNIELIGETR